MGRIKFILFVILLSVEPLANAAYYGAQFSYSLVKSEPSTLNGYQFLLNYNPENIKWYGFNIYFDAGFAHYWITSTPYYTTLNIYSIAPVLRYKFKTFAYMVPYFEVSIGIAYLNHTRLDDRNLGIHFAFQDRIGVGTLIGASEKLSIGVHAMHFSNAHLASHNSGITIPVVLDIGYRFN